jgi:hypothetical protein
LLHIFKPFPSGCSCHSTCLVCNSWTVSSNRAKSSEKQLSQSSFSCRFAYHI